jgi:ribosomal protein L40E
VTGGSAVQNLLAVAMLGALAAVPLFFCTILPGFTVLPLGLLAAFWVIGALFLPWLLRRTRAADVVLDLRAGRVTVDGGPTHGTTLPLAQASRLLDASDDGHGQANADELDEPGELASRKALRETFESLARPQPDDANDPALAGAESVLVAVCDACGAFAPAAATEEVPCDRCGASVVMPETLRDRLAREATSARSEATIEAALEDLWRQPGPRATNGLLALAAFPAVFAWPFAGVVFDEFFQIRGVFSWSALPLLFASATAVSLALVFVLRVRVDARRAFALVCLGFHARPSASGRADEPPACGGCGASLSADERRALERCRYCRTDNLRWIRLPLPRLHLSKQLDDLETLLAARARRRRRDRGMLLAALGLLGVSLLAGWSPLQEAWEARHAPFLAPSARPGLLGRPVAAPDDFAEATP